MRELGLGAKALGMQVLVHSRGGGIALPELLARADYVSVHVQRRTRPNTWSTPPFSPR
jgi:phosphoglycerate dehydrogenase-like enzyme